jgi:hypothetical protein
MRALRIPSALLKSPTKSGSPTIGTRWLLVLEDARQRQDHTVVEGDLHVLVAADRVDRDRLLGALAAGGESHAVTPRHQPDVQLRGPGAES